MIVKRMHFYVGLAVIIHFAITGLLMRMNTFSIRPEDTVVRIMFRANHIYILFSGLVNLLISYTFKQQNHGSVLSFLASGILILATIGINFSFYVDPIDHLSLTTHFIHRKLTAYSIQSFLAGTVLYLVCFQFFQKEK